MRDAPHGNHTDQGRRPSRWRRRAEDRVDLLHDLFGPKGTPLDLIEGREVTIRVLVAQDADELAVIELGHEHVVEAPEHIGEVRRQGPHVAEHDAADTRPLVHGPFGGLLNCALRRAPAEHEQVAVGMAVHLRRRNVLGHVLHLLRPDLHHLLVVLRVVGDIAGLVFFLQPPEAMLQIGRAGPGPDTGQRLRVAHIRQELVVAVLVLVHRALGRLRLEVDVERRERVGVGDAPRLRPVPEVAVGQHEDGRAVLGGDAARLVGGVEAVARRGGREHRKRGLAIAAVDGLQEVALLRLRGQAGGGAAALHVDHDEGQLRHHPEADCLRLEGHARAGSGAHAEVAPEAGAERRGGGRDLVLGLEGDDAKVLVLAQLVQNVGRRRDGVGAVEEAQVALHARGHQPQGERLRPPHGAVGAGRHRRLVHLVPRPDGVDGLPVVESLLENRQVGVPNRRLVAKLLPDPLLRRLHGPGVHPEGQPEGKHVLRPVDLLQRQVRVGQGLAGDLGEGHLLHLVVVQRAVRERVLVEVGLRQVLLLEGVDVDDDGAARPHAVEVHLERRRVHGDEQVHLLARRAHLFGAEVKLEGAHAKGGAGRGPNLGGVVRQRRQVVLGVGGGEGKLRPGNLHSVPGVPSEEDRSFGDFLRIRRVGGRAHSYRLDPF